MEIEYYRNMGEKIYIYFIYIYVVGMNVMWDFWIYIANKKTYAYRNIYSLS